MKTIKVVMIGASLNQNGGIATLEKILIRHAPKEIEIQHITSHDEGSAFYRILVFGWAWLRFVTRCVFHRTDIVHIHLSDGGSVVRKLVFSQTAFLFRKPVLMHANGAEFHQTYERLPPWMQHATRRIFGKCQSFAAVTNLWKNYYIDTIGLSADRVVLLANPAVLPESLPVRENAECVKLAFCGRIGDRKGAFDLLQAFSMLPESLRRKAELVLAGDGEVERGKSLAKELGISERVQFLGWIDAGQVQILLREANVFVLPSYNEGLPLALMEAMGWGLPVITTPVSGIPDIVKSSTNGILVTPGDIGQLTSALELLLTNEPLRLAMGREARTTVEPLDIRVIYSRLLQIYRSMAQAR
jgi:glycosyltransferase involved in cell wall biosynthesis